VGYRDGEGVEKGVYGGGRETEKERVCMYVEKWI